MSDADLDKWISGETDTFSIPAKTVSWSGGAGHLPPASGSP
jgi:hypothetical protein